MNLTMKKNSSGKNQPVLQQPANLRHLLRAADVHYYRNSDASPYRHFFAGLFHHRDN